MISRDLIDGSCFQKYVAANAIGWYKFVNESGCHFATNGDLRLVVGWDHCSSWSRFTTSSVIVHSPDNMATAGSFARFVMSYMSGCTGVLQSVVDNRLLRESSIKISQSSFGRSIFQFVMTSGSNSLKILDTTLNCIWVHRELLSNGTHIRLCVSYIAL